MRGTTTLLIALTALICSTHGYSIDRPKRDNQGIFKTTEAAIPSPPKDKRSIPNRRRSLPTKDSSEDGDASQSESRSDIALEMVKTILGRAIDETNQQMKKSSSTRDADVSGDTAKWLKRLKAILVAEIDNLVTMIGDGRYADVPNRPRKSVKSGDSLRKSSIDLLPSTLLNFLTQMTDAITAMTSFSPSRSSGGS